MRRSIVVLLVSVVGWISIVWQIADTGLALDGTTILRWAPPVRPTAFFNWESAYQTWLNSHHHQPVVQPGQTVFMTVTPPRAFRTGQMMVTTKNRGALFLRAETRSGRPAVVVRTDDAHAQLNVIWSDLVVRGRKFRFSLTVPPDVGPVTISAITVRAQL